MLAIYRIVCKYVAEFGNTFTINSRFRKKNESEAVPEKELIFREHFYAPGGPDLYAPGSTFTLPVYQTVPLPGAPLRSQRTVLAKQN